MSKASISIISLALLLVSCNAVFVESPMPKGGTELKKIPQEWSGVYEVTTSEEDERGAFIKNFLRFERLSDSKLLVSAESRMPKTALPALDAYLSQMKADGQNIQYQITDRFIFFQENTGDKSTAPTKEARFVRIEEKENWYVFVESAQPFMLLDLSKKTVTEYNLNSERIKKDWVFPDSDSLGSKEKPLALRQKGRSWYLNIQEEESQKWSCMAIHTPAKNELKIILNILQDEDAFINRLDYYKSILPIESKDGNFFIDPSDEAFERFLAEPIFETWTLKKVE